MTDVLATLAEALTAFAVWLDSVSPIPWPLALAILFPPMVMAFRLWVWLMRGSAWPTICAYVTLKQGFCKRTVPGEWHKCWYHGSRRVRRTDAHAMDPHANRWELRTRKGEQLDGIGFLSHRTGDTILFQRQGFARRPRAVGRYLTREWPEAWRMRCRTFADSLRSLKVGSLVSEDPSRRRAVSKRAIMAHDVMRTIVPALVVGFIFTAIAIPLDAGGRQAFQYVATVCFVAVWGFARYGLWHGVPDCLPGFIADRLLANSPIAAHSSLAAARS